MKVEAGQGKKLDGENLLPVLRTSFLKVLQLSIFLKVKGFGGEAPVNGQQRYQRLFSDSESFGNICISTF